MKSSSFSLSLGLSESLATMELLKTPRSIVSVAPRRRSLSVRCRLEWDPEGILGRPQSGHFARKELEKQFKDENLTKEVIQRQAQLDLEKRRAAREARVVPLSNYDLVDYFLVTEAQEMDYEIARCRPRLNDEFFAHLQKEMGSIRFSLNPTKELEDRMVELEVLTKVLKEGVEAYDKMTKDLVITKERLGRLLASRDKKATMLEMVEKNELDRSLLALLDMNIAAAIQSPGQEQAVEFMQKVRSAMLKYITS